MGHEREGPLTPGCSFAGKRGRAVFGIKRHLGAQTWFILTSATGTSLGGGGGGLDSCAAITTKCGGSYSPASVTRAQLACCRTTGSVGLEGTARGHLAHSPSLVLGQADLSDRWLEASEIRLHNGGDYLSRPGQSPACVGTKPKKASEVWGAGS